MLATYFAPLNAMPHAVACMRGRVGKRQCLSSSPPDEAGGLSSSSNIAIESKTALYNFRN
jgi:hypothetical protein